VKFVVAGYGTRGDVEPCIAVAGELLRRGHDVQMAVTVPPDMLAFTTSAGLVSVPFGRDWQALLADGDFVRTLEDPLRYLFQAVNFVNQTCSEKTTVLMSVTEGADLLVAGMTEQQIVANVADYYGVPLAALHFYPPELRETASPGGSSAATHPVLAHRRALGLPEEAGSSARPLEIQAYDALCSPLRAAEWAHGDGRRPFVGALTLELPTDADDEVLSWIASGRPPVYFGFGSTPLAAPGDMVALTSAACALLGERALIHVGPNDFSDISHPDHVKFVGAVNNASIFPGCAAVVHHGGAGTTAAALRAGTPQLILWGGIDQPFWAATVRYLEVGVGRYFPATVLDSLVDDLRLILTAQHASRAREVATQMTKAAESLSQTADLLEEAARQGHEV